MLQHFRRIDPIALVLPQSDIIDLVKKEKQMRKNYEF
jgi:hypothetical protein